MEEFDEMFGKREPIVCFTNSKNLGQILSKTQYKFNINNNNNEPSLRPQPPESRAVTAKSPLMTSESQVTAQSSLNPNNSRDNTVIPNATDNTERTAIALNRNIL